MLPIRLAMEDATSVEAAAIIDVVKNSEPKLLSRRSNFRLKNKVTHVLSDIGSACLDFPNKKIQHLQRRQTGSKGVHSKKETQIEHNDSTLGADRWKMRLNGPCFGSTALCNNILEHVFFVSLFKISR